MATQTFLSSRSSSAKQIAERRGFVARTNGARRDANPHSVPTPAPNLDPRTDPLQRLMAEAWRRGWERADSQLA